MEKGIAENNLDNRKVSKDIKGLSERAKKSQLNLSDLIIPLSSLGILILLSVFLFVPMIGKSNEYRSELKEVNEKLDQLDNLKTQLDSIDETSLLNDLLVAKEVIPKVLKVSDYVFYIDNLAQRRNLATREISAGDVSLGGDTTEVRESLGVSGPLSYSGDYNAILDFLDEIQGYSPYLVTLRNISLSGNDESWSVDFDMTGYYIPESNSVMDLYRHFSLYTKFDDILDIFKTRSSKLNEL